MGIVLTSEQLEWLEAAVAAGRFASVQAAVDAALVNLITGPDHSVDEDDDWVAPLLAEARASDARGESITLDEFKAYAVSRRARSA